ncbi:tRNA (adenosine(37)-N6)-dimethylallyltransferase MiaA [Marixanthomonas sp. SCSIO 43207]|uniref:tRNA (adenosine(37)-N6)-dimethylallyltransferase MiaA n=1 Tax=Marixanthomonas sp. SCSIO 43207 TaxID=2779360 RepID=UPI001CA9B0BF|nr:tRNA (adenosine(37)-N6)-dimethylallyltransferase MiaA [Marixanthomonas sp. SCSIO 43207]UAB81157.1 tRNA (adenosine(37)-N6)-dimethylallyltransferase MiaA [Marixanthomonas sp. SCSIO 43207]
MAFSQPLLICVVGPTAIGKTKLAINIAQLFNTEIISADSRQFFKEMTIGTAVPSSQELDAAPHHFIQNKSIFETYSVGDFETEALETLKQLFKKKDVAVMVGGSGLYVDAVVKGLDSFPKVPKEIREALTLELEENGLASLQKELENKDAQYYKKVDHQNPHRVIRALEVIRVSGKPYSSFLNQKKKERFFDTLYVGLTAEREVIYSRINQRVDNMMDEGLLDEAKQLYKHRELNALQTVGYKELFKYLDGTVELEVAVSEIKKNTRRFAKRQNTWFKKNPAIHWFNYTTSAEKIVQELKSKNAL